jgi:O-antigen/teichoic acid export membrane protein
MRAFFRRWQSWIQRLAAYGGVQILVQLVNAASGFVLVRTMEKEHYAWFTLVNSLLATLSILTDSGLGSAMMSLGGQHFDDKPRFASLMLTSRRLRMKFMLMAAVVTLPAGWWLLAHNGAAPWLIVSLLALVFVTSLSSAEGVVLGAVNKLERRVDRILQADVCVSLSRLGGVLLGCLAGMNALLAAAATAVAQWAQILLLRRQTRVSLSVGQVSEEEWKPPMMKVVRELFPLCLFQAVQGHLTTWVLGIFAVTSDVADVGALSRFGIVFSLLGLPFVQLLCPVIARTSDPVRLKKLCWLAVGGYALVASLLALCGVLFADFVLWVLGGEYRHLKTELAWYLGAQTLGSVATATWGVAFTRSWVRRGWLVAPITLVLQAVAATQLNLTDVRHAIAFGSISQLVGGVIAVGLIARGLREHAAIRAASTAA